MIAGNPVKSKIWIFYVGGGELLSLSEIACARTVEVQKYNGQLKYHHFACRDEVLTKQEGS